MLGGTKELYLSGINSVTFPATYIDSTDETETPVKVAQKNTSLGSVNDAEYSVSLRTEFIIPVNETEGINLKTYDRLKIGSDEYSINGVEPLRIGAEIVSYTLKVNS